MKKVVLFLLITLPLVTLGQTKIKETQVPKSVLISLDKKYDSYKVKTWYQSPGQYIAEFVYDGLKDKSTGVTTMDVAKRLLDYGYHAPTIYFPLLFHESLMIEPTENESKETLDAFIDVMRRIAEEARTNPDEVKSAPHTTPIGRVDDVLAAKHPVTTWKQLQADDANA